MYARVTVFKSTPEPLWYAVPLALRQQIAVGSLVRICVRAHTKSGVVQQIQAHKPQFSRPIQLKSIEGLVHLPNDPQHAPLLQQLATLYQIPTSVLHTRMHTFLGARPTKERASAQRITRPANSLTPTLNDEQQQAYQYITQRLTQKNTAPYVLHGVTGSGKTEVYKRLIIDAHTQGLSTIFMVPEVTLALNFERLLAQQLSAHIPLFSFHSATTPKQKRALWDAACAGIPAVIIGVHLPVLLPLQNLGLIIVDEEHDPGYEEKKHPKINSRIAALMRAHAMKIPIVLGSATPSTHTLYGIQQRSWRQLRLTKRFAGAFPKITVVPLTRNTHRKSFWISRDLEAAIAERLQKQEQSIIFLNRRGYSFFVQCKTCGHCFCCTACSVSLTVHQSGKLLCHYCGLNRAMPTQCSACQAPEKKLLKRGVGTQQVVEILTKRFPTARIGRADLDVTKKKTTWKETLHAFKQHELDILVGTQTITKGYDFPGVTLVGAIWADMQLHAPVYNATETALAQLIQVAGRAGRHTASAQVIMQVMEEHPCFAYLNEQQYPAWYTHEIAARDALSYPPCARVVCIELKHHNEQKLIQEAELLYYALREHSDPAHVTILGPCLPLVAKIQHIHARQIILKAAEFQPLYHAYTQAHRVANWHAHIHWTPLW